MISGIGKKMNGEPEKRIYLLGSIMVEDSVFVIPLEDPESTVKIEMVAGKYQCFQEIVCDVNTCETIRMVIHSGKIAGQQCFPANDKLDMLAPFAIVPVNATAKKFISEMGNRTNCYFSRIRNNSLLVNNVSALGQSKLAQIRFKYNGEKKITGLQVCY